MKFSDRSLEFRIPDSQGRDCIVTFEPMGNATYRLLFTEDVIDTFDEFGDIVGKALGELRVSRKKAS